MSRLVVGIALLIGAGFATFTYFTVPQRVYGAKTFDCPVHEISWERSAQHGGPFWLIRGCGREELVRCLDDRCQPASDEARDLAF